MKDIIVLDGKTLGGELPLRSLFYGEGVFETFRWKGKPPILLDKHLGRMRQGARFLGIPYPGDESVKTNICRTLARNETDDLYVKVCLLSSGPMKFSEPSSKGHVLVVAKEYSPGKPELSVHIASARRNSSSPLLAVKSLNYLENMVARREAEQLGHDESVFLNGDSHLAEGCSTNIFWAENGSLFTPELGCGLLPGITREALITVAKKLDMKVKEGKFKLDSLLNSQGAFLTNSLIGMTPISRVDDVKLANDKKIFARLKGSLDRKLGWRT